MTWNNRVIDHGTHFGLHEVHYAADGSITGWTRQPMLVADPEDGVDGLIYQLERALRDAREREVLRVVDDAVVSGAPSSG